MKFGKKVSSLMSKDFDSNPVYGGKYIESKIRSYKDDIQTNFRKKETPREKVPYKCLSVIMLESVI